MRIVSQNIINHSIHGGKPNVKKTVSCSCKRSKNTSHEGCKHVYQENDLTPMHLISRIINKTEIDLGLRILSAILLSQMTKHFDLKGNSRLKESWLMNIYDSYSHIHCMKVAIRVKLKRCLPMKFSHCKNPHCCSVHGYQLFSLI